MAIQKTNVSKKVTKSDLLESICKKTGFDKEIVQEIVESFVEELKSSLKSGSNIELRGFGTFEPRLRKGRKEARNPKTGEKVTVEPHYVAAFRAGRELKQELWNLEIKK